MVSTWRDQVPRIVGGQALAILNARVFTADLQNPWAEAVLVRDGRIAALGSTEHIRGLAETNDIVLDASGRLVMPGIHDAHIHLGLSGLKFRYECRISPDADGKGIVDDLTTCCAQHEQVLQDGWIVGGEVNPFHLGPAAYDRGLLDTAFPDRPVFLYDYTVHHGYANTAALRAAGIDADTPDPFGGRFLRRPETTEPTGELVERATWPIQRVIPEYPPEVYRDAVRWAVQVANRFGITSMQEASAGPATLTAFGELDARGELTARVAAHLVWKEEGFGGASERDLDALLDRYEEFSSPHVRTNFVKLWLDGAPVPPHSTAVWLDENGEVDRTWLVISEEELHPALQRFDAEGRTVKIHCAAPGSVRVALDAIEAVRNANGPDGPLHEAAHCAFVSDEDVPRFAALRVVAEMSPALWHRPEPEHRVLDAGFKFRTTVNAGALMTIGSDWIITPDPNLFPALQGVVERGEEALTLEEALRAMTIDGATAVGNASEVGSLEVGKVADLIVLDRDLFVVPSSEIGDTNVLLTLFEGQPVYQHRHEL